MIDRNQAAVGGEAGIRPPSRKALLDEADRLVAQAKAMRKL